MKLYSGGVVHSEQPPASSGPPTSSAVTLLSQSGPLAAAAALLRLPAAGSLTIPVGTNVLLLLASVQAASGTRVLRLQFNDDAAVNYGYIENRWDATGAFSQAGFYGDNFIQCSRAIEAIANVYSTLVAWIFRPLDTDRQKVVDLKAQGVTNGAAVAQVNAGTGIWQSTAAITSLRLSLDTVNLAVGSWAGVYAYA